MGKNKPIEWHIITSCKGGIGKTLHTMLLASHNIEMGKTTLVLDLNAMNADSSALLVEGVEGIFQNEQITVINPNANTMTEQLGAENITIKKFYSSLKTEGNQQGGSYNAVGWPSNPFGLYKPTLFANFICTIKKAIETSIKDDLGLEIESVIIDTNYSFANIFAQQSGNNSQQNDYYRQYKEELNNDHITVWFLWVYRQLDSLIKGSPEANNILLSADQIERHFTRENDDIFSPIMHVITPISLLSSQAIPQQEEQEKKDNDGFYYKILNALKSKKNNKNICVKGLENAELLPRGPYKTFREWVTDLAILRHDLEVQGDPRENEGEIFLSILRNSLQMERPRNVIPLWDYHIELQRYTDKFSTDPLAYIREYEIYTSFKNLLEPN